MRFNLNNEVRVKLTDKGRDLLRGIHAALTKAVTERGGDSWDYKPPVEDSDGWSTWQLWSLMQAFGPHIYNGCQVPFETEIDIIEKN